jgi:prolyl-tRNA synthetase
MKGAEFTNEKGEKVPYYMGCYGIGIGRTLATVVEKYNDGKGIIWPKSVAPFTVHLLGLDLHDADQSTKADKLYIDLQKHFSDEVLFDDRIEARAGEKFADADLIGCPVRVVVSKRSGDKIEVKERTSKESTLMTLEEFVSKYA